MGQYSIKDVELLSGVKAHTLRIWEQRYGFIKPDRTDTNIRYYSDEELRNILNISLLNKLGMRISKIADLSQAEIAAQVLKVSQEKDDSDVLLNALVQSMIEFDENRFEKTLSQSIMRVGFQRAFTELIFPFMIRTGVLWATGTVRPAQEHFISNLIRRKVSVAIDNQYVEETPTTKRFVLFLPEGENHELLLLFTEYVLRQHNHHVAYLGNSLPYEDVHFIEQVFKPNYLVTYFTIPLADGSVQDYINRLSESFPGKQIIVGGAQLDLQPVIFPANVKPVKSIDELLNIVAQAQGAA